MPDQVGTPSSNADNSVNGSSKPLPAQKDKACPFCHQQFTSSSLGRHLDLYIREKHPKPQDGIHIVDQIRKLRGGITRRQPRQSLRRRETSTPGDHDRGSPAPESAAGVDERSPSMTHEDIGSSNLMYSGRPRIYMQPPSWEATGVMNNIPPAKSLDARSADGEEKESRRLDMRSRQVSKQLLAKTAFEQKQKLNEALDDAKATELALRELLGSLKAANRKKLTSQDIFDYDPLTLDFPSLCLHCLPPPPTLHAAVPIHHSSTWNISPPGDNQYEALRAHFSTEFRNHRNRIAIASTAPVDDLSYPPPAHYVFPDQDTAEQARHAEIQTTELEQKVNSHIHDVFAVWTGLSGSRRAEVWTTELARSVGRKSTEIERLHKEKEYDQQVIEHLKHQIDDISRLQHPREFRLVPPQTLPISQETVNRFGETRERFEGNLIGWDLVDRKEKTEVVIEKAVSRWKNVVREARGAAQNGLQNQRSLSDSSILQSPTSLTTNTTRNLRSGTIASPLSQQRPVPNMNHSMQNTNEVDEGVNLSDEDADADADADMEEDESYADLNELENATGNVQQQQHGNGMGMRVNGNGYRMANGIGRGMDGIMTNDGS